MPDLKELRNKAAKKARKVLHSFDFDDTLFKPISKEWIEETVQEAKESIGDGAVLTVLITGRKDQPAEREELERLLAEKGLEFDEVIMNDSQEKSPAYKARTLEALRERFPALTTTKIWENDADAKKAMTTE